MSNFLANKHLIQLRIMFNFFFRKEIKHPLGRWNLHYDLPKINSKVDLANEDHCGSCGKYAKEKQQHIEENDYKNKKSSSK